MRWWWLLLVVAACRGSRPPPVPAPEPIATTPPPAPDAAPPAIVEEELEEEVDPLEDLAATLSARPFAYLYRHTAEVTFDVHWTQVSPESTFEEQRVVYAAVPPGGPTLVCVKGEICWSFEGEMKWLRVPEKLNNGGYPYLYILAVMPDQGRVDMWQRVDGGEAWEEPEAKPPRHVDIFEPDDAPAWARPWVDLLDPLDDEVQLTTGKAPVTHVFVGEEETGRLCIEDDDRFRCGAQVRPGDTELTVHYGPGPIDFGPDIVAIDRNLRGEIDGVGYVSATAKLLFDISDPAMPWVASVPVLGYARLPERDDEIHPMLDLWRVWEVTSTPPLDPDCFTIRRARGASATRVVGIGDMDTPIEKKAKLPRFPRPDLIPTDATAAQLATGWDFAGSWGISDDGGLERRKKCRK
jgi:hypothetical protein